MKSKSLVCLAICLGLISTAQVTVTLQCSGDAAIGFHDGAGTAGSNYGTALQNAAFYIPASASPTGTNGNRALMDFNIPSIGNATVISASLNLYALGPHGTLSGHTGSANACYLKRITQSWQENVATWNNQPTTSTANQVTLPASTSPTQDYLNINVKGMVQDMVNNPSTSFGFLLRLVNEANTNALVFASRDHSNPALRPTLVVTYETKTTALHELQGSADLILYPVPAGERLYFDIAGKKIYFVEILDAQGKQVLSDWYPDYVLDISPFPDGIYFIRCIDADGTTYQQRFVHTAHD